jgi:hypothetical protein
LILFRQTDPNYPFTWETNAQPEGRWHAQGDGPVHYFATTADGAWAEFLRHEEITDPEDLQGLRERQMWALELEPPALARPQLTPAVLTGGLDSWPDCQHEAGRQREAGAVGLVVASAALVPQGATLYYVDDGERTEAVDSEVVVLFGPRNDLRVHLCAIGRPSPQLLQKVRPL